MFITIWERGRLSQSPLNYIYLLMYLYFIDNLEFFFFVISLIVLKTTFNWQKNSGTIEQVFEWTWIMYRSACPKSGHFPNNQSLIFCEGNFFSAIFGDYYSFRSMPTAIYKLWFYCIIQELSEPGHNILSLIIENIRYREIVFAYDFPHK